MVSVISPAILNGFQLGQLGETLQEPELERSPEKIEKSVWA